MNNKINIIFYTYSCGCVYRLVFLTDYNYNGDSAFVKYAYISGLKNHEIAYVTQASENEEKEGIEINIQSMETTLKAHILRHNYRHTEDKLYVGFKRSPQIRLSPQGVAIKFLLKTSYFHSLRKAVKYLPDEIILRITPGPKRYQCTRMDEDACYNEIFKKLYDLDDEQYRALNLILAKSCPNELPLLIDGPFGTGKTYVLAAAANALFRSRESDSVRILVCTQQQKSAEHFLEIFTTKLAAIFNDGAKKILLRDHAIDACRSTVKKFVVRSCEIRDRSELLSDKLLTVTTCSSAHYLQDVNFTHIFIDEGAQMREPEAVAALRMAKKDTKIVIAGDPHQVNLYKMTYLKVTIFCGY
jgi:hypothetical protein